MLIFQYIRLHSMTWEMELPIQQCTLREAMRIATDVGGTFTDLVICRDTDESISIEAVKVHTTPPAYEQGVFNSLLTADIDPKEFSFFAHGSTVVINALTERKGVKTGLITTRGFRDVLEIARGNRPDFFNLRYAKPKPFIPRYLRKEITERIRFDGSIHTELCEQELDSIIDGFRSEGVNAIAICLLHAYANPAHEQRICELIREKWPQVSVVASHHITREWREYERTNTTALCAYIQPIAAQYLDKLSEGIKAMGFDDTPYIMQSNGGIDTVEASKTRPITLVESGPASGVLATAALGKLIGENNLIAFDIGGTTAKCSLIHQGTIEITSQYMIERDHANAGYPIMAPVIDLVEIGNGGGSIAWVDEHNKLHVGPQSAGADPGPAAYGNGGIDATTTDANIALNRINPEYLMGGQMQADMDAVNTAFTNLGEKLDLAPEQVARGVIRIANNNMVNALKLVSVNRGYDPRDFTLVAFGGGGSMHAAALAEELSIPKIIIPKNSSVFSAWGMLLSDLRRDYVITKLLPWRESSLSTVEQTFSTLETQAIDEFTSDGQPKSGVYFERYGLFRYVGQEHTVTIGLDEKDLSSSLNDITERFHQAHEREYSFRINNPVEVLSFHLVAYSHIEKPDIPKLPVTGRDIASTMKPDRKVDFDSYGILDTHIYDREKLEPNMQFDGPAVIEESGTTTVVMPSQKVSVDDYGNLHIHLINEADQDEH